jgi:CBS domain-containing protein
MPPVRATGTMSASYEKERTMKVKELMTRDVRTVAPHTPLKQVAAILAQHRISGLPVCDADGRVVGVVSEADILYKQQARRERSGPLAWLADGGAQEAAAKRAAYTAGETMSEPPVTIGPDRSVAEAARLMIERKVNRLPVVKGDELVGIVTRSDVVRAFTRSDAEIAEEINEQVLRRVLWIDPGTVNVHVTQGLVTLAGVVEGRSDVQLLKTLVERVPGVVDVHSEVAYEVDDAGRAFAGAG